MVGQPPTTRWFSPNFHGFPPPSGTFSEALKSQVPPSLQDPDNCWLVNDSMTATDWGAGDGGDVAEAKKKLCFDPSIESIEVLNRPFICRR